MRESHKMRCTTGRTSRCYFLSMPKKQPAEAGGQDQLNIAEEIDYLAGTYDNQGVVTPKYEDDAKRVALGQRDN